jgi:hypothetical protein
MKDASLATSIALMVAACAPSAGHEPVQQYRIEATGSVDCLAEVAVLLLEQGHGGYDAPQWQTTNVGTASFEPIPAPLLERAKAAVLAPKCVTQVRVMEAPARL